MGAEMTAEWPVIIGTCTGCGRYLVLDRRTRKCEACEKPKR